MGIEYFIIAMDESASKEDILKAFTPYWTEVENNYYFLNYGVTKFQGMEVNSQCHFSINFNESSKLVEGITIYKPCGDIKMEKSIFRLIRDYPMFITYPSDPLVVVTANPKCFALVKKQYPDFIKDLKLVSSFEEYLNF